MMILSQILEKKQSEIASAKERVPQQDLLQEIRSMPPARSLSKDLTQGKGIHLIAEIKRASPSAGILRESFDPVQIALDYQASGASAISVLTDEPFFMGCLEHLSEVKAHVHLPILRKDFLIDIYQIYQARAAGADAILLISDLLSGVQLLDFLSLTSALGMEALVEVHSLEDLEKALGANARIIGINHRDLKTFKLHRDTTERLIPAIPKGKIIVAESGIRERKEVVYLETLGVHAVLIGETFMRSSDIGAKVREILGT